MTKSVEQKLFEAYKSGRGLNMTADDVGDLVFGDDSLRQRITGKAVAEDGRTFHGGDAIGSPAPVCKRGETWHQFKRRLRDDD